MGTHYRFTSRIRFTISPFLVVWHDNITILTFCCFTITSFQNSTIQLIHYFTIKAPQYCMIAFRVVWAFKTNKHNQDKSYHVFQVIFFWFGCIESMHTSMSLDTNNRDISILNFSVEPFIISIPVLQ